MIAPYGGALVDLLAAGDERDHLLAQPRRLPSLQLSARSLCDLELLGSGAGPSARARAARAARLRAPSAAMTGATALMGGAPRGLRRRGPAHR